MSFLVTALMFWIRADFSRALKQLKENSSSHCSNVLYQGTTLVGP
jgi:hypothetical protein